MLNLKPIELQIAIPKTADAGNFQNQLLQKPVHDQTMQALHSTKQMEQQRKKSNEVDSSSEHLKAEEDGNRKQQQPDHNQTSQQKPNDDSDRSEHPYKGHHVDLSL